MYVPAETATEIIVLGVFEEKVTPVLVVVFEKVPIFDSFVIFVLYEDNCVPVMVVPAAIIPAVAGMVKNFPAAKDILFKKLPS